MSSHKFKIWYEVDIIEKLNTNLWRNHFCAAKFTSKKEAELFIKSAQKNLGEMYRLKLIKISIKK